MGEGGYNASELVTLNLAALAYVVYGMNSGAWSISGLREG